MLLYLLLLNGLILLAAIFAFKDKHFAPSQARGQLHPSHTKTFTFLEHGGMWSDFFVVSPLIAWLIAGYSKEWGTVEILFFVGVSSIVSIGLLFYWDKIESDVSDSLRHSNKVTAAGKTHFVYMAIVLSVLGMFFLRTQGVSLQIELLVASIVSAHVLLCSVQPSWKLHKKFTLDRAYVFLFVVCALGLLIYLY